MLARLLTQSCADRSAKYQITHPSAEDGAGGGGCERPAKLTSWALWDSMGRPKFVCAPMVEQSVRGTAPLRRPLRSPYLAWRLPRARVHPRPTRARGRQEREEGAREALGGRVGGKSG